jgi:hypothetical protein
MQVPGGQPTLKFSVTTFLAVAIAKQQADTKFILVIQVNKATSST